MQLQHKGNGLYVLDAYLMRTNSAIGDRSWVARISGLDPKYKFARTFVDREKSQSRPTNDGRQTFGPLRAGEIYEFRNVAGEKQSGYSYNKYGGMSGFFVIVAGELQNVPKAEVAASMLNAANAPSEDETRNA